MPSTCLKDTLKSKKSSAALNSQSRGIVRRRWMQPQYSVPQEQLSPALFSFKNSQPRKTPLVSTQKTISPQLLPVAVSTNLDCSLPPTPGRSITCNKITSNSTLCPRKTPLVPTHEKLSPHLSTVSKSATNNFDCSLPPTPGRNINWNNIYSYSPFPHSPSFLSEPSSPEEVSPKSSPPHTPGRSIDWSTIISNSTCKRKLWPSSPIKLY